MGYNKRVLNTTLTVLVLLLSPVIVSAQAPVCGEPVTTDVTFAADLECVSNSGGWTAALLVGADGVTINLGTHVLRCLYGNIQCDAGGKVGIDTNGHSNVTITGSVGLGTIAGFDRGVQIIGGGRVSVTNLTIDGGDNVPVGSGYGTSTSVGIMIAQPQGTVIIGGNDVSAHTVGVKLVSASGVKVQNNRVHENSAASYVSHGILLEDSPDNVLTGNDVYANGHGLTSVLASGLTLDGPATIGNRVSRNQSDQNCGDGISVRNGASGNTISGNSAFGNPGPAGTYCYGSSGVFFDIAERGAPDNRISRTNDCTTSNITGVCP